MVKINEKLGERIIAMLTTNPKIVSSIKKLEKICDKYKYEQDNWARNMIIEWAYTGCIFSSLNQGGNPVPRLNNYVKNIKTTLEHNRYSDPAFYVPEIFNAVFK